MASAGCKKGLGIIGLTHFPSSRRAKSTDIEQPSDMPSRAARSNPSASISAFTSRVLSSKVRTPASRSHSAGSRNS